MKAENARQNVWLTAFVFNQRRMLINIQYKIKQMANKMWINILILTNHNLAACSYHCITDIYLVYVKKVPHWCLATLLSQWACMCRWKTCFHFIFSDTSCDLAAATDWDWLKFLIVTARVMLHLLYTAFNNLCKHEHSKLQDISQWVQLC